MIKLLRVFFSVLFLAQTFAQDQNVEEVSIVSTANVFSEYFDCGCPKNPLGGFARKSFFLKKMMPDRQTILVDAGNIFYNDSRVNPDNLSIDQRKFKAKHLVDILEQFNHNVVNIGSNDFKGGKEFLVDITNESSVSFISANLRDKESGNLLFKPYQIVEEGGFKIGFIGLSEATRFESIINENFIEVGNKYINEIEDSVDIIVLLINLSEQNQIDLASSFKDADFIFLSGTTSVTGPRTKQSENGPKIYAGGVQGKNLSILDIRVKDFNNEITDVSARFNRLQEIDFRLNRLQAKDPKKTLESLYSDQPNVLDLIKKYQKEAVELGQALSGISNRSIFFSVPLSPSIPDDEEIAAFIDEIARKADFPLGRDS